jgi:D-aminoacyl-tRNA deacylase
MLANYALPFETPEHEGAMPSGNWSQSIRAAISSTRDAFPGGHVVATLERKSFKAWQRNAIIEYLTSLDVPVVRTKDIEALV